MRQNATQSEATPDLNPKQETATELLISGRSATEIASSLGIHRSTIHRWLQEPAFLAALNQRRSELREASDAKLQYLQTAALSAVERAVEEGDVRVALSILRGLGFLPGRARPIGLTDADRLARQQEIDERERKMFDSLGIRG